MFDSSSKLQAGIFIGNLMEYGSFRQCIEIYANSNYGPIRGQHCTLKVTPNDDLIRYVMSYRNISRKVRVYRTDKQIMKTIFLFLGIFGRSII